MKKVLAFLSVVLIAVSFTNEANAYTIGDGDGVVIKSEVAVMTVADVPTPMTVAIDNVTVASSVENVAVAFVIVNYTDIDKGGSIVSDDAADPDEDNLVATYSKRTMLLHLLSLRHPKKYLASVNRTNEPNVTDNYKPYVKVGEIPTNVGKLA